MAALASDTASKQLKHTPSFFPGLWAPPVTRVPCHLGVCAPLTGVCRSRHWELGPQVMSDRYTCDLPSLCKELGRVGRARR